MSESVIRACSKQLPSRLEEREGRRREKLASLLSLLYFDRFAWPGCARYVLPENSNDTLRGLLYTRHRKSSSSSMRRNSVGGVPGSSASPRPSSSIFLLPSNYRSIRGVARPLSFYYYLLLRQNSPVSRL